MSAKKKKNSKRLTKAQQQAQEQAQNQILAVLLFTIGLLFLFLAFVRGSAGWLGAHNFLLGLFGPAAFFIGPILIYISVMASFEKLADDLRIRSILTIVLLLVISAACQIFLSDGLEAEGLTGVMRELYRGGQALDGGGVLSALIGLPLMLLGSPGDKIVVLLLLFALMMIITRSTLAGVLRIVKKPVDKLASGYQELLTTAPAAPPVHAQKASQSRPKIDIPLDDEPKKRASRSAKGGDTKLSSAKQKLLDSALAAQSDAIESSTPNDASKEGQQLHIEDIIARMAQQEAAEKEAAAQEAVLRSTSVQRTEQLEARLKQAGEAMETDDAPKARSAEPAPTPEPPVYTIPPLTLLREHKAGAGGDAAGEELRQNAQRLVDVLQSFGVQARITDISRGPAVTRYELQPSAGVKISKITNLADDIALNLASSGIRIEAPIPNKAAVGIEVPNHTVSPVTLREVIDSPAFADAKSRVTVALGRDIAGSVIVADIAKMPHLLIAGATGSGKSVCINSIIMSILYKARPDEVKLMLVDPKVVELGVYNSLPHLVVPVVNDAKKAAGLLSWAVNEMLQRYKTFAQHGARDVTSYNKLAESMEGLEKLPHIVIVVDELADLMMAAPSEVEDYICRLAQMARAAGMHLIIATQRPSVDVITGVIKANIPSRIAFAVSSQVDSRTILDMGGAEKLMGAGDMLFYPVGSAKPVRVQGCYVSDDEIERVVSFIKSAGVVEYDQQIIEEIERQTPVGKGGGSSSAGASGGDGDSDDAMLQAAIECVVEAGIASTSLLQRKCKLGYARAARIIDELEARGIVGPFEGSKPRQVLISRERWMEMKLNQPAPEQAP